MFQSGNVCTGRHANVAGGGGGDGVDDDDDDDDEAVEEDAVVDVVLLLLLPASTRSIIAVTQVGAVTAAVRVILVGTHGALSTLVRGRLSLFFFFFFDLLEEEPCEAKCRRDLASAACSKGSLMEATVVVPVVVEMVVEEEDEETETEASASASLFLRAALLDPGTCLLRAGAATTKEVFGNSTPCIFGLDLTWNTEGRTYGFV